MSPSHMKTYIHTAQAQEAHAILHCRDVPPQMLNALCCLKKKGNSRAPTVRTSYGAIGRWWMRLSFNAQPIQIPCFKVFILPTFPQLCRIPIPLSANSIESKCHEVRNPLITKDETTEKFTKRASKKSNKRMTLWGVNTCNLNSFRQLENRY